MRRSATRLAYAIAFAAFLVLLGGGCGSGREVRALQPAPAVTDEDYLAACTEVSNGRLVRWTRLPIPVYLDRSGVPENWREEHAAFFEEAMSAWTQGSGGLVSFARILEPVDPCIKVHWVRSDPMGMPEAGAVSQLSALAVGGKTYFTDVRIDIRTTTAAGDPEPDSMVRVFSAHELGHALGIWGHSDRSSDLLYPTAGSVTVPSPRDLATLAKLYSLSPEVTQIQAGSRGRGEPWLLLPQVGRPAVVSSKGCALCSP